MLHQRIISDIRDHFSTVGPSPVSILHTSGLSRDTSSQRSPFQTGSNRLILLPPPSNPDNAIQRSFSLDVLAATAHRGAAFFAEAAVLVLVLGILDRFLASNRIELRWVSGAFLIALGLLAASIATDVSARRWLRAH